MRNRWSVFVILLALLLAVGCVPVAAPAPIPTSPPPQATPASSALAYIFNMGSGDVSVIDTNSNEIVRTAPIAGWQRFRQLAPERRGGGH